MSDDTTTPTDTPDEGVEEPKPSKTFTQAEVNELIAKRAERIARQQYGGLKPEDITALQERASQYDALEAASRTDQERAVEEARRAAAAEAIAATAPRLVAAEFRAAAAGTGIKPEQLSELLEDLDLSKYLDKKGEVDVDRIQRKITALAPAPPEPSFPDLGGGRRGDAPTSADMNRLLRQTLGRA